jgi:hypothetical protein
VPFYTTFKIDTLKSDTQLPTFGHITESSQWNVVNMSIIMNVLSLVVNKHAISEKGTLVLHSYV